MKMASSCSFCNHIFVLLSLITFSSVASGSSFIDDCDILFGDQRVNIKDAGRSMSLAMDRISGSGIKSKNEYLFGRFDMQIKLVPGNSAGTVTAFYLSSEGDHHDEIDMEFLGNLSGDPYVLSTNLYADGKGDREVQFYLWFDPTADFHTYSIDWNPQRIIILVDNIPIRVMRNRHGVPFPIGQPMRMYTTLWDGDDWATRGGRVKTDWRKAPFVAEFRDFNAIGCIPGPGVSCEGFNAGANRGLDSNIINKLREIHSRWVVYDYCRAFWRYPHGLPKECQVQNKRKSHS